MIRSKSIAVLRYQIDPGLGVTDDELNRGVRRVTPPPGARVRETKPVFAELRLHWTPALHPADTAWR